MRKIHTSSRRGRRGHRWPQGHTFSDLNSVRSHLLRIDRSLRYLGLKEAKK